MAQLTTQKSGSELPLPSQAVDFIGMEIAINASESEIVQVIRAAVHFRNDVFYVQ